ncbi:hypothetical protein [Faecalibacterium hattorii]|uniref:hypothetical protein n=1 Tax=Faecalibacterium hattorii TaxID=2935520 RepID=UPI003AB06E01
MNDFDTFWHEAKAALRVALQWFFLAVPMGLLCGLLGTLFPPCCRARDRTARRAALAAVPLARGGSTHHRPL